MLMYLPGSVVGVMETSVYDTPAERAQTKYEEGNHRYAQAEQHPAHIERGQSLEDRHHSRAQPLGGIGQRIEERDDLEPLDRTERTPGVVGAAGEDQRREDQREHQADLLRLDERTDSQAETGPGEGRQHHDTDNRADLVGAHLVAAS